MTITKRSADKCTPPFSNVINYQWGLPDNTDKVAPKISYTEVNPHWGWYISAGSYMEDYNNGANRVLDILLVTLGASLLVGMVIILLFSHHLAKPLQLLTKQVQLVSSGHLDVNELRISNRDEIGTLASSVNQINVSRLEMEKVIQVLGQKSEQIGNVRLANMEEALPSWPMRFASWPKSPAEQADRYMT